MRKLYFDEMYSFYKSAIFLLELKGEIKKGTYNRLNSSGETTVSQLRRQLFGLKPKK